MLALFGMGLACVAVAGWALAESGASFAPHLLAGSGLYLVIAVTTAPCTDGRGARLEGG